MAGIDVDDLLSDDSNDSFFEEPKVLAKRSSIPKTNEKKNVADIFGFTEEKEQTDDWLGFGDKKSKEPSKKVGFEEKTDLLSSLDTGKQEKKQQSKKEDEEILSTLGFSSKKPIGESKKTSLFSDILGTSPKRDRKTVDFTDILTSKNEDTNKEKPIIARESRRVRSATSNLTDPLGLFSKESKPEEAGDAGKTIIETSKPPVQTRSTPNISELPDWLSDSVKQHKSEPNLPILTEQIEEKKSEIKPEEKLEIDTLITQQKLSTANIGLQNTAIAMQQQESQLVVALQLKKYEEKLMEMQQQQQEILLKQDRQFNDLLQKQFLKQQILEENMRQQQQRIQNHIELLIQQPLMSGGTVGIEKIEELKKSKEDETMKLYEDIIGTLKQRQHEEVFLLEESYK